jgi:hypothetical protein
MLRLFGAWRNDGTGHRFPEWAHTVPVYETLLQRWRGAESEELAQLLQTACEHHFEQAIPDKSKVFHDFGDDRISRVPLEILMLLRLREIERLSVPGVEHPIMEPPFNELLPPVPVPEMDAYMKGTLERVHEDWPHFDDWMTLDALRRQASLS